MRVYEAFETSERLTSEGRECEIEFGGKVICIVRVRPADVRLNAEYRRDLAETAAAIKGTEDDITEARDLEILYGVFARTVVLSIEWTDPEDKKDPKLRFHPKLKAETREKNFIALCTRAPMFFAGIRRVASQWANYRAQFDEEAQGNS